MIQIKSLLELQQFAYYKAMWGRFEQIFFLLNLLQFTQLSDVDLSIRTERDPWALT